MTVPIEAKMERASNRRPLLTTTARATFDRVCIVSAVLGAGVGAGGVVAVSNSLWQLGAYVVAFGVFHLAEFWVTARYNASRLGMASFLLTNGLAYAGAQLLAISEVILYRFIWKYPVSYPWVSFVGLILVMGGQILRSWAMITAAANFSHLVQHRRSEDHTLVTTGVYGIVRHPSYAAFYIWALGMQLMVVNPVSLVAFAIILWVFFKSRIDSEEDSLMAFFGDDYVQYRSQVPSGIPFV